jgi:hypothetical protein
MRRSRGKTKQPVAAAQSTGGPGSRASSFGTDTVNRGLPRTVAEPVGPADDAFEREADRVADLVARGGLAGAGRASWSGASSPEETIQRTCAECAGEDEKIRRAPKESAPQPTAAEAPATAPSVPEAMPEKAPAPEETRPQTGPTLLTEDEADVTGGQMRKSEFLAALRVDVCAAVDGALIGTGRDSQSCPWIDHWLGYYQGRSSSQIERSLHRYAPESRGATSAQDCIQFVTARVRRSAETWAKTGEITGVPDDIPVSRGFTQTPTSRTS